MHPLIGPVGPFALDAFAVAGVAAGATRVGASAGVRIVQESRGAKPAVASPSGY